MFACVDRTAKGSVWVKPDLSDTWRASVQTLTALDQLDSLADGSTMHHGQRVTFA